MSEFWRDARYATTGRSQPATRRYGTPQPPGESSSGRTPAPEVRVLRAVLDRLREGIQVWSLGGTTIYENVVMERMLSNERLRPEPTPVRDGTPLPAAVEAARRRVADEPAKSFEVGVGDYTVTAEPFDMPGTHLGERGVLVRVRSSSSGPTSPDDITCRFGLTRRQSEVACLLARGLRNDEIARTLDMSPSTARRHTECVLAKLGVRSRAEIAATLVQSASRS